MSTFLKIADSVFLRVKTRLTRDQVIEKMSPLLDLSNYPKDCHLYNNDRPSVPGFYKGMKKIVWYIKVVLTKLNSR